MIRTWHEGMSDAESKDLAYWERNMLALRYADGWYNDEQLCLHEGLRHPEPFVCPQCQKAPRYPGWRRVLSLEGGKMTFHVPDDFEVGNLPETLPNWDGHTTEEKWRRVQERFGIISG